MATPSSARSGAPEVRAAHALAERAAGAAGIAVREVHDLAGCALIRQIFDTIWSASPTNPSMTAELLRAYGHTGQYVVVADDLTRPGEVVAASAAFLSAPAGHALHSHVTGVLPQGRGRSLGFALKAHQRAWALDRGLSEITWTFDPLIRRNAWFNLAKLGARPREYLVDFYGPMSDGLNAGDASDRLYVAWPLADVPADGGRTRQGAVDVAAERAAGAVTALAAGPGRSGGGGPVGPAWPPPPGTAVALAQVPPDVETLRRDDPAAGRAWREGLRAVLGPALDGGWTVRGVDREGWYVLDAPHPRPPDETAEESA